MKKLMNCCLLLVLSFAVLSSCGPKAFVKGQYEDPTETNLMNDQWSETDMQVIVKELVSQMLSSAPLNQKSKTKPVVMFTKIQNKTSDHIDTQSVVDMMMVQLNESGQVSLVNKQARQDVAEEYDYQKEMVENKSKSKKGQQIGAQYIIDGRIDSITQEVGKDKTVYYKLTLNVTDLKTNIISWTSHKEIRKRFKKKTIGL